MENLKAKKIIKFRKLSEISRQTFIKHLKTPPESKDGGGDYWVSCLTAVSNAYKKADVEVINEKIEHLLQLQKSATDTKIKARHKSNTDILIPYTEYDFSKLRGRQVKFLRKPKTETLLTIKGLTVQVEPSFVFSYNYRGVDEIGAIWFVAQKNGFKSDELGIFSELAYRYLYTRYRKSHHINPNNCIVIDIVSRTELRYSRLLKGEVAPLLDSIIEDINAMLKK
jgi:hypothetical protein